MACNRSGRFPKGLERREEPFLKRRCLDFLRDRDNILAYLPHYKRMPAKNIMKKVCFEISGHGVFLFDYGTKDPVTERYKFYKIKL